MSAILKKRVRFWLVIRILGKRGVYNISTWQKSVFCTKRVPIITSYVLKCQCFVRKGVPFMSPKVSVLKKRGNFFSQKVSGKGSLLILENDHTSSLLQMSGGTGIWGPHVVCRFEEMLMSHVSVTYLCPCRMSNLRNFPVPCRI